MRGTAAEYLAKYLLIELGYEVADVLRASAAQDVVIKAPGTSNWASANIKRAYRKASDGNLWVNTEHRDGRPYDSEEIEYIIAVRPPEDSPAYWADIWLIPFDELLHKQGRYHGLAKGRLKLTKERDKFKI